MISGPEIKPHHTVPSGLPDVSNYSGGLGSARTVSFGLKTHHVVDVGTVIYMSFA